ncbi:MAG: ribonuclease H-like domain-containing protein [Armatimonadota bacterium]|nr:ribonuclease H-like domain-containing protein [Armatimonadota bacterium]MCX7777427.1 ribonuclease H-like domain-containing protein [Armatimonadota bacterium]MDW8025096.1 ribonuclease H-like domain-containing protein [Armatimonadota bacterium]
MRSLTRGRVGSEYSELTRCADALPLRLSRLIREANLSAQKVLNTGSRSSFALPDEVQLTRQVAQRCCPIGVPHYRCEEFEFEDMICGFELSPDMVSAVDVAFEENNYSSLLARSLTALMCSDVIADAIRSISNSSVSELLKLRSVERVLFVDCETLGFHSTPVFLIGALERLRSSKKVTLHQWLAHDYSEEPLIIDAFLKLASDSALVTFNGKSFDLPMLRSRCMRYKLSWVEPRAHIDLLHISRRLWRKHLSNCRLSTICVAIRHPVSSPPSSILPEIYRQFVESKDEALRESLLVHNAVDVCALPVLLHAMLSSIHCSLQQR